MRQLLPAHLFATVVALLVIIFGLAINFALYRRYRFAGMVSETSTIASGDAPLEEAQRPS